MKFLLESNLSKLAKWLRFFGYDVKVLEGSINMGELLKNKDRIFITTSTRWERTLKNLGIEYLVVPRHSWEEQLCAVIKHFKIKPELKLDLCAVCGSKLKFVDKEEIKDKLPPKVYSSAYDFAICPECGYVFWKGLHYERMKRMLKEALKKCSKGFNW